MRLNTLVQTTILAIMLGTTNMISGISITAAAELITEAETGFTSIFNGKNLDGWSGAEPFWRVEDGAIVGQTTKEKPTSGNTFIVWQLGSVDDFELKLSYRIDAGNSGIQYRSSMFGKYVVGGHQADFEAGDTWSGAHYEERGRGILAARGEVTVISDDKKGRTVKSKIAPSAELQAKIKKNDWNEYHIIARGNRFIHKINGQVMSDVTDNSKKFSRDSGILALQLHAGPPMKVEFKNIRLKRLPLEDKKKVVFVPGGPSHGRGSHEHLAGCRLLMVALNENMPGVLATMYNDRGFPKDPTAFDNADTVVVYCDGGGGHLLNRHLEAFDKVMGRGVGLVCVHYGVEVPKGKSGVAFLKWIGGYFEPHWSVNPHWDGNFKKFPDHPIARGVKPFKIKDEWYYHMRFAPNMKGVTPILTDLPPKATLNRRDGPHSGNPAVRAAIAKGEPQHVAWAFNRPGGGRGFGFTGGHFHRNWGNDNFRKLMLNAIVWTTGAEVPAAGVSSKSLSQNDLDGLLGQPPNRKRSKKKQPTKKRVTTKNAAFSSKVVTKKTPGQAVEIDVDISGAKQLFLVVTDGGNGFSCDWANWAEPRLVGPTVEKKLTQLKWKSASSAFGSVQINRNCNGGPMRIAGKSVAYGIGTHANSIIAYDIPPGFTRFKARGGLDNGGSDQGACGDQSSVQFMVFTKKPPAIVLRSSNSAAAPGHDAKDAVAALDVHKDLKATLFASEPQVTSLTNLDIDHRGRIWVCEVVNYRGNKGRRPEGDRILILEDTNGDGKADKTKVYYQGRDIDSAMGIAVFGNKVIVSCSPNVFVFTDTNGDDKPDKKELLFTKTGQPQHDHSAHSVLFGPDGKMYWNFGNMGRAVHDKHGKPIIDRSGNPVIDNGKPYYGGMAFRCNLDGTDFEVLGHNFRNNYEVTVDSFGTVWQSDNDDDGNRGVRINFVMEHGNYGYRDEKNGAGWGSSRIGMSPEKAFRHWHQNDPGVVPNLLNTGAGSPTGITVYEGTLLPSVFHNQVIHCDAGPNVVRAYPVKTDGAGYKAEIVNILKGTRDNWFRPADVAVAPDGSLFVTDWYDPGVGGHGQRDLDRGRIFRVAPKDHAYQPPKFDFTTPGGAIAALKNPNFAVRYMAWQALIKLGDKARPELNQLTADENPRLRARAIWFLGKNGSEADAHGVLKLALADPNPNVRTVGIRLARQQGWDLLPIIKKCVSDKSPIVRREAAIALRGNKNADAASLWVELALQYDGQDRWYLESLGIAAHKQWDTFLAAWLKHVGSDWNSPAGRDIIWRSRADVTPRLLAAIIRDPATSVETLPHYFRAFHFLSAETSNAALASLAFGDAKGSAERRKAVTTTALKLVGNIDIQGNPKHAAALDRALNGLLGTPEYITLVNRFNVAARYPALLSIAQQHPEEQLGIDAITALISKPQGEKIIRPAMVDKDVELAAATIRVVGRAGQSKTTGWLLSMIQSEINPLALRREAVRAVAKTRGGANQLIKLARSKKLDEDLRQAAALPLSSVRWREIREQAAKLFPTPPAKNNKPLPPIEQLLRMRGDVERGKLVFAKAGTCANCHQVRDQGKEVGPELTEIGSKLSRSALFESILFPSAGISHSYETISLALTDGDVVTGILISETPQQIELKTEDAIVRRISRDDIEVVKKQNISLMPADLQKNMTLGELVDVVEYLSTLKKNGAKK